jgi:hypothetical protein
MIGYGQDVTLWNASHIEEHYSHRSLSLHSFINKNKNITII